MKYDKQLIGFTTCLFIISFLLLFGIETRYFIYYGSGFISVCLPLLILLLFMFLVLYISRQEQNRVATKPAIFINGKKKIVEYRQVKPAIRTYVANRVRLLEIGGQVTVVGLPSTYNVVDAYVFGSGRNHTIALTGGAQALYLLKDPRNVSKFTFLIDHELGHIKGQDTGILYFAKSILTSILVLIPVKFLLIFLIMIRFKEPVRFIKHYYGAIFPAVQRDFGGGYDLSRSLATLVSTPLPVIYIVLFILIFSVLMGVMLLFFYREILRRREFLADLFALQKSYKDKTIIAAIMESLLSHETMKAQPAQGFKSNTSFHPSASERVRNILTPTFKQLPSAIATVCILGVCFSFRFCYGNTIEYENELQKDLSQFNVVNLILLSGLYCLLLGFVFDHVINSSREKKMRTARFGIFAYMLVWSFLLALLYKLIYSGLNFVKEYNSFSRNADAEPVIESLKKIATTGIMSMVYSMPFVVLCFGLSFYLLPFVWKANSSKTGSYLLFLFCGIFLSVSLLTGANYIFQDKLDAIQAQNFRDFEAAQQQWGNKQISHSLFGGESPEEKLKNHLEDSTLSNSHLAIQKSSFRKSGKLFFPPLCFIALWQTPYNPSIFYMEPK